jgi:F420-dependent oxidoreductase-like protein
MRIGLQIPIFTWPGGPPEIRPRLAEIARSAEAHGFASLWVMDHFFQIEFAGEAEQEMLEGYSTLSYLAALTDRVTLGTLVTGVTYRHPGVLVKTVSTLDTLSGGRAVLGIGAAWYEREHRGLGVPYPPLGERFERLEETLQIAKQMWSGEVGAFEGRHYQLAETLDVPAPLARPHPPILIGGMGERKTLRLVARYADASNMMLYQGPRVVAQKLDVLRRHCDAEARDFDTIDRTTLGTVLLAEGQQTPRGVISLCRELAEAGVTQAIFNLPNVHDITPLETFGKEIIPAVAEL